MGNIIKISRVINKINKQINFSIPKKQLSKEFTKHLLKKKFHNINFEDFE
jgi:hypothetical protein